MDKKQIEAFFTEVDTLLPFQVTVALTGAAAGSLMGRIRPSRDIDFAISTSDKESTQEAWNKIEQAVYHAIEKTGIAAEYARDIERWSMISLLDYADHLRFYKNIGKIKICFLAPEYWSIGKMGRFLDLDIQDILEVFSKEGVQPQKLAALWGKALKASPRSMACNEFRKRVEYFFQKYGPRIWDNSFDVQKTIRKFRKSAGIA